MPTPTLFITLSLLLKVLEGIGLAMFDIASLTLLTQLFLHRKSTLSVSDLAIALLLLGHLYFGRHLIADSNSPKSV